MKKWFVFILLFAVSFSPANGEETYKGEIVEYGIIPIIKMTGKDIASGSAKEVTKIKIGKTVQQTTRIPLKKGLNFGIKYIIQGGIDGQSIQVVIKGLHPEMTIPNEDKPKSFYQYRKSVKIGAVEYTGYQFENTYEMVEGKWILQVWHGDKLLCQKAFDLFIE